MTMRIGLDVGTGTTKVVLHYDDPRHGPHPRLVPTAVCFHAMASRIPDFSPSAAASADELRCDGFPAMLGAWPHERVPAWGGRTPTEVTQSFLHHLLSQRGDEEERLVVTVDPAVDAAADRARNSGARLVEVLGALGHPPQRVLPTPIAVLAHVRREDPELADATRFAVCDIGAGGMSFALCTVAASGAQVTGFARLRGTAAWGTETAAAGAAERPVTLAEGLVAAIAAAVGAAVAGPGDPRSVYRWRSLEAALASQEQGSAGWELRRVFDPGGTDPGPGVLRFADIEVTAAQLLDACAPPAAAAGAALSRLLARSGDRGWRRFGPGNQTRIVLTGGLAGLPPVRAALLRAAGLDPRAPGGGAVETGGAGAGEGLMAAALGAALVAAGETDPSVRYPYALRLPVHREVRGRIEMDYLELAAARTIAVDQTETPVNGADGAPLVVSVPASHAIGKLTAALPLLVVRDDGSPPSPAEFYPAQPPPVGDYRLLVSGDPAGAAIVLHEVGSDRVLRYVLRPPAGQANGAG
jgi:hypothetical protein